MQFHELAAFHIVSEATRDAIENGQAVKDSIPMAFDMFVGEAFDSMTVLESDPIIRNIRECLGTMGFVC